jgi:C1A family cysteine protease
MMISPQSKNISLHQSLKEYQKALSCNGNREGHPKCFCDVVSCQRGNDYGSIQDAERLRTQREQGNSLGRIKNYVALSSEDEMVSALDQYGPLVASIRVTKPFSLLANNLSSIFSIDDCTITDNKNEGYHAIAIVGYGIDRNQIPYWLIRNSWGTQWCDLGYFKMIRNTNMCGIADDAYYAVLD